MDAHRGAGRADTRCALTLLVEQKELLGLRVRQALLPDLF
jgi:hypothetical protein